MRWIWKRLGLLVMCAVLAGCDSAPPSPAVPKDWQTVYAGNAFTFRAPTDLKAMPVQGIDSFVGRYTSPSLDVSFDYGQYSDPMKREGYRSQDVSVDGRRARLVSGGDEVAIHFPKVSGDTRLTMSVHLKGADAKTAEILLRSIDFP